MSEIHALSGAYAIDALDDTERAQFEGHLSNCAECTSEVVELRATSALLADDAAVAPPAGLRSRVLAEIASVRPLPPEVGLDKPEQQAPPPVDQIGRRRAARRTPRWSGLAVAAAAVIALGVTVPVVINSINDDESSVGPVASATDLVLQADDAQSATVELLDGAEATLVRSEGLGQAVLITKALPSAPAGKAYQMWLLTDNGTLASAGLMKPAADQTILLSGDAAHATAAAISVEPEGGSKQPTTEPVALIDFSTLEQA